MEHLGYVHPGRLTWNIPITHLERKLIFQTPMIMFHVNLQGCILDLNLLPFCEKRRVFHGSAVPLKISPRYLRFFSDDGHATGPTNIYSLWLFWHAFRKKFQTYSPKWWWKMVMYPMVQSKSPTKTNQKHATPPTSYLMDIFRHPSVHP